MTHSGESDTEGSRGKSHPVLSIRPGTPGGSPPVLLPLFPQPAEWAHVPRVLVRRVNDADWVKYDIYGVS